MALTQLLHRMRKRLMLRKRRTVTLRRREMRRRFVSIQMMLGSSVNIICAAGRRSDRSFARRCK